MKKVLIGLAVVAVLGLIALATIIGLESRDIAPPDTSDFIIENVDLVPEENAYTYFLEAGALLEFPEDRKFGQDYLEGKDADAEAVSKLIGIAKNKEAIALVEQGVQCRACVRPAVTTLLNAEMPYVEKWRQLGRLMALETRHHRLAGRFGESTSACIRLLKFADLIHRDAAGLLDYFSGTTLLRMGLEQARDLTQDPDLPSEERQPLSVALAQLESPALGVVRAFKVEHQLLIDLVDRLEDGDYGAEDLSIGMPRRLSRLGGLSGYFFQPNKTRAISATYYRHAISQVSKPCTDIELSPLVDELSAYRHPYSRPNVVGRTLCGIMLGGVETTLEKNCMTASDLAATRLIVACHSYRDREGKFPETLQALVPEYVDAVPDDPYDGKPFRYDAAKKIVYSVGMDAHDSGGTSEFSDQAGATTRRDRRKEPDIVYEIDATPETSPSS